MYLYSALFGTLETCCAGFLLSSTTPESQICQMKSVHCIVTNCAKPYRPLPSIIMPHYNVTYNYYMWYWIHSLIHSFIQTFISTPSWKLCTKRHSQSTPGKREVFGSWWQVFPSFNIYRTYSKTQTTKLQMQLVVYHSPDTLVFLKYIKESTYGTMLSNLSERSCQAAADISSSHFSASFL